MLVKDTYSNSSLEGYCNGKIDCKIAAANFQSSSVLGVLLRDALSDHHGIPMHFTDSKVQVYKSATHGKC